jgi:hypothetical protein
MAITPEELRIALDRPVFGNAFVKAVAAGIALLDAIKRKMDRPSFSAKLHLKLQGIRARRVASAALRAYGTSIGRPLDISEQAALRKIIAEEASRQMQRRMVKEAVEDPAARGRSDTELRFLASRGNAVNAILEVLFRDMQQPLEGPDFEAHLTQEFRNQGSRDLACQGYRLRLAEQKISGPHLLNARGQVDEILHSNKSTQQKTEAIIQYFEEHGIIGLGEPIRPYVLARFDEIREACDRFVSMAMESNSVPRDELHVQTELYHRLVAYGYAYRAAEELVRAHAAH